MESAQCALKFLEVPRRKWQSIINDTVCAAVAALAFMHRTRFSIHSAEQRSFEWSTQAKKEPFCKSAWNARAAVREPKQNGEFYLQYSSQLNAVTILISIVPVSALASHHQRCANYRVYIAEENC